MAAWLFKILIVAVWLIPASADERTQEGFASLPSGHQIFYHYKKAQEKAPTLVLLNGLDHDTSSWQSFLDILEPQNDEIGILAFDMHGMGKSFLHEMMRPGLIRYDISTAIPFGEQTQDLKQLLELLKIEGDLYLLGLSYGAAIALDFMEKNPGLVKQAILAAPYLAPLPQQDSLIKQQIALVRQQPSNPLNFLTDDRLYDLFLIPIVSIYPLYEPILLQEPWKIPGVYRMVQGGRLFDALAVSKKMTPDSIHVLWAEKDEYLPRDHVINFHRQSPQNIFASETIVTDVHHDLVRQVPNYLASFILKVLTGSPLVNGERKITAYPFDGYAERGAERWEFAKDTKSLVDHLYLSKLEIFFSPITWNLLDGSDDGCEPLLTSN
ncbi:MAG: alpha/beta fold hydrolase [Bdellovibrionales bacterium]